MRTQIRAECNEYARPIYRTVYTADEGEHCADCNKPFEQGEHATRRTGVAVTPNGFLLHYPLVCSTCRPFKELITG